MMQQFLVMNRVIILMSKKTEIKSAENSGGCHFTEVFDINGIYVQRFALYCKIEMNYKEKHKMHKQEKHCAETTIHNINVLFLVLFI